MEELSVAVTQATARQAEEINRYRECLERHEENERLAA
jgi:hypothetical protein